MLFSNANLHEKVKIGRIREQIKGSTRLWIDVVIGGYLLDGCGQKCPVSGDEDEENQTNEWNGNKKYFKKMDKHLCAKFHSRTVIRTTPATDILIFFIVFLMCLFVSLFATKETGWEEMQIIISRWTKTYFHHHHHRRRIFYRSIVKGKKSKVLDSKCVTRYMYDFDLRRRKKIVVKWSGIWIFRKGRRQNGLSSFYRDIFL